MEAPCKDYFLFGDNDDGDYVGVGAVVHTLFFYLEAPCKAIFFTWRPLVRPFFYLEAPCKAFFYLEIMMMVIMLALVLLFIPFFLLGGPL